MKKTTRQQQEAEKKGSHVFLSASSHSYAYRGLQLNEIY